MELLTETIPNFEIKDLVIFTHNTDILQKYVEYLMTANKILIQELSDLKIRTSRVEEEQKKLPDICFRLNVNEKKITDIYESINHFKLKFIEVDRKNAKFEEVSKIVENLSENTKVLNEKTFNVEKNLVNLNKLTESNIKAIEKESNNLKVAKEEFKQESNKIINLEEKFISFNQKIDDKYREFDGKFDKISVNFLTNNNNFNDLNERLKQIYTLFINQNLNGRNIPDINKIINIGEMNTNNSNIEEGKIIPDLNKPKGYNEDNSNNGSLGKAVSHNNKKTSQKNLINTVNVESLKNPINNNEFALTKDMIILKTNIEMNLNKINNEIKNNNKDLVKKYNDLYNMFTEKFSKSSVENSDLNEEESNFDAKNNLNLFTGPHLKVHESPSPRNAHKNFINHANANYSINRKPKIELNSMELEPLELAESNFEKKLADLEGKIKDLETFNIKSIHEKQKNIDDIENERTNQTNDFIKNFKDLLGNSNFEEFINEKIKSYIDNIEEKSSLIKEFKENTIKNTEEIDKLYESILALRKVISEKLEKEFVEFPIFEKVTNELDDKLRVKLEAFDKRLFEENKILIRLNNYIQDATLDLIEFKGMDESTNRMRDYFNTFIRNIKYLLDKTDKNSSRIDNLSQEILNKLKKDLWNETLKTFEEFKQDLKQTIVKIDNQLRDKVDINNFNDFDKKLDQKISNEFNKKIDKTELRKNNQLINKKIDTLESKISKTLVDTLIDLQLEETPLILKKVNGIDKCGSCNQILTKENNNNFNTTMNNNINNLAKSTIMKLGSPDVNKFQLKNIQDASNKLGFASYSRFISHLETDSIDDVNSLLKQKVTNNSSNSNSLTLPDIVVKGNNSLNVNTSTNMNYTKLLNTISPINNTNQSTDFSNNPHKKSISFLDNMNPNTKIKPKDILKVLDKYHSDLSVNQNSEIVNSVPNIK